MWNQIMLSNHTRSSRLFITTQTGLIVIGIPLTNDKMNMTLAWKETDSTDWLLYFYYTLLFV